jgi:glutamate---cysteine ligase / carboxylate-amine ligase
MVIGGIDLTLGVEEEYQIVNPETRDLDSNVRQLLENGVQFTPYSSLMPELMQSQIKTGSSVCYSVHEVHSEIIRMRRLLRKL